MKNEQEIREVLTNNTIRLIANGGFEKATTKAITHSGELPTDVKMNEVHIYRLFGSKEGLYSCVFDYIDREIFFSLKRSFESHKNENGDVKAMLHGVYSDTWRSLLRNEEHCRCYIQYYYSAYFKGESLINHNGLFDEIIAGFVPLFKEGTDVKSVMHSVFTAMCDFAVRVYNGDLRDTDSNAEHIFNVLYSMMSMYLKPENSYTNTNN